MSKLKDKTPLGVSLLDPNEVYYLTNKKQVVKFRSKDLYLCLDVMRAMDMDVRLRRKSDDKILARRKAFKLKRNKYEHRYY